ncbi:MAG TPA: cyclic nucleotide-binding domain-containing protein [Geminicoccaceae bacterium]|nr:cyclic nucleotide-binding domain-containing protein [Geminicoccaceae bacterium]
MERYQVAIVGSGPAGLSAGARAAARGLNHVVLERQELYADTIQKYQRGKFVMASPEVLPLRSDISFVASSRERILGTWADEITQSGVQIRYGAEVAQIKGKKGAFAITLRGGGAIGAEQVVLAIGVQGNLRKLDCPGGGLPLVQYQLDDPDAYAGETIVVIGAGDSAIENAIGLSAQNSVIIVNRRGEFARAKAGNLNAIERAIESGRIGCVYNAAPAEVMPGAIALRTPEGTRELRCDRIIARLGADPPRRFLESTGIVFPKGSTVLYPEVSETYETNVAGLYAIGAIVGYPLIKNCMNQGYEVVETIAGHPVEPADEPLMQEKLIGMPGRLSVAAALEEIRSRVRLFRGLTTLQLREFLLDSDTHILHPGEVIFERDGFGDTLFCIASGSVAIELSDPRRPDAPRRSVVCREGDFFGEAGLVAGRRRAGTARAATDCVLIELARRSAIKLLNSVAPARELFERTTVVRPLPQDLAPEMTEADLAGVIATAEIKRYPAGAALIEEGARGDQDVYLIRSGSVNVSRRVDGEDVVLAYRPAGSMIGEMALVRDAPRRATVTTAIETEAIRIDGAALRALLDERPALRARVERVILDRVSEEPGREADPLYGGIIKFFDVHGVDEATDVLLIDESLCIRCDNCEKACAESHDGFSRLNREAGPTFATLHVPIACRHCEQPHCMADCPPDAIHRAPTGEVWIDDTCISCGNCEENCPYSVIQMTNTPPPKPGLLQWLLLGRGPGPGGNRHYHPPATEKKVATKCDACRGIDGGPACVRACPTGAAIRVNPKRFLETRT